MTIFLPSPFFSVLKVVYETLSLREMVDFLTEAASLSAKFKSITEWPFHPKYFAWNKH